MRRKPSPMLARELCACSAMLLATVYTTSNTSRSTRASALCDNSPFNLVGSLTRCTGRSRLRCGATQAPTDATEHAAGPGTSASSCCRCSHGRGRHSAPCHDELLAPAGRAASHACADCSGRYGSAARSGTPRACTCWPHCASSHCGGLPATGGATGTALRGGARDLRRDRVL